MLSPGAAQSIGFVDVRDNDASKALVGPKLAELGRRFALSDFEEAAADD